MSKQIVAYIRVSTARQGKSGLGLEAQREALARFAAAEDLEIVAEYLEVETGKGSDAFGSSPLDHQGNSGQRQHAALLLELLTLAVLLRLAVASGRRSKLVLFCDAR